MILQRDQIKVLTYPDGSDARASITDLLNERDLNLSLILLIRAIWPIRVVFVQLAIAYTRLRKRII